jgi:predicted nucleic acid-binding Zn ribbon protein
LINPVRSEQEAFRFLVYVLVIAVIVVGVVLLARAL